MAKTKRFPTLKQWRVARGLSQREAAELLGVTQVAYGRYELGLRRPRPTTLKRAMVVTGVPLDVLAGVA